MPFQTLIGTVKSPETHIYTLQKDGVSNPHRYGQKLYLSQGAPDLGGSFKPS